VYFDAWLFTLACNLFSHTWISSGSLDRASSILIPRIASPPLIRDTAISLGTTDPWSKSEMAIGA
jgi:hypothetical protein